jgi:hypothetical protein
VPQPIITGTPFICQFGNQALPNGQGTLSWVNLNDLSNWFWQDFQGDNDYPVHAIGRLAWRTRGVFLGQDAKERTLTLPTWYSEATSPLGAGLQKLSQAGLQQLSFDNATAVQVKFAAGKSRALLKRYPPLMWSLALEFIAPTPWFSDLSATVPVGSPWTLGSGSATTFNVTYAGGVFVEPIWTLTIPNTNVAPIASFSLSNTMSGETLTITFPGNLAASTAWTVTIDSGAMTVVDGSGKPYDVGGNAFPLLYAPVGTVNAMSATLTPASGTATGCKIAASYNNRWEF